MIDAERQEYTRSIGNAAEVSFASTLDLALQWKDPKKILDRYDGVILGGSGEFDLHGGRTADDPARMTARQIVDRIRTFVDYVLANDISILGICFGHQLIAEMHGGKVTNDHEQKKVGTYEVSLTEEGMQDRLFSSLPKDFTAQYGHKDSVTSLPTGATLLAVGPACKFSVLRYGPRAYTTQFHPELTAKDVYWKLEHSPGYLPEGIDVGDMVKESTEASRIIPLFIERIV